MTYNQVLKYVFDRDPLNFQNFGYEYNKENPTGFITRWEFIFPKPAEEELPSIEESNIWIEQQRQSQKSLTLKTVENKFLQFCDQLTNSTSHIKLGFDQLYPILESMLQSDPNTSIILSVKLLAIDAEAKREGGNLWWDDCTWHPEIV